MAKTISYTFESDAEFAEYAESEGWLPKVDTSAGQQIDNPQSAEDFLDEKIKRGIRNSLTKFKMNKALIAKHREIKTEVDSIVIS